MIRRSTLVFFTCLGALGTLAVSPFETRAEGRFEASDETPPVLVAQSQSITAANVLSIGSRGRAVTALQNRLQETGYYDGSIDGLYGLGTQQAVLAFQEDQGLEPSGRLDDETWAALESTDAVVDGESPAERADSSEDLPPVADASPSLPAVSEPAANVNDADDGAGGIGKILGFGVGLAALAGSFGVGFFMANRSKSEAAEGDAGDDWGEVDPQVGVLNGDAPNGPSGNGAAVLPPSGVNGASGDYSGGDSALAPVPVNAGGQLSGTSPMAPMDVVDGLIKDLHNPDPSQRRKIIWELGQRGNSIAVQPLVDAMVTADSKEKSLVLAALSEIGIRSLKPMNRALAIALKDDNPEVRKNAIRDLTRIYDLVIQISQMLGHATEDEDPEVRQTATWALDQLNRLRRTQDIDTNMRSFNSGSGPNRFAS
ncbi:MAG: peptidoglycan-binding protein [Cyanobacteria bacterium J06598_1]